VVARYVDTASSVGEYTALGETVTVTLIIVKDTQDRELPVGGRVIFHAPYLQSFTSGTIPHISIVDEGCQ
jgi:hypothetical protein